MPNHLPPTARAYKRAPFVSHPGGVVGISSYLISHPSLTYLELAILFEQMEKESRPEGFGDRRPDPTDYR